MIYRRTNSLVSVSVKGGFANGASFPDHQPGGRFVASHLAQTLPRILFRPENLFYETFKQDQFALTTNGLGYAAMTLDGRHVALGVGPGSPATDLSYGIHLRGESTPIFGKHHQCGDQMDAGWLVPALCLPMI